MHPFLTADGAVSYCSPAVEYPGEWFVYRPFGTEFQFAYYEREVSDTDDIAGSPRYFVELLKSVREGWEICFSCFAGDGTPKTELWRGTLSEDSAERFDPENISSVTFPSALPEIMALCEPNG